MLPVIAQLVEQVDRNWASAAHRTSAFPDVAAEALTTCPALGFPELAREISSGLVLPRQRRLDQSFGQPALTLHHGERYVIEALCWHTGSPAIHQHSFAGAFRVATGRSVHSRFRFTERGRVAENVAVGDLDLLDVEVLGQAAVRKIDPGSSLIHAVFHLDDPSMTVIVRTHDDDEPEYTYLPPGVAYDPAARTETLHKQLQLLDTMDASRHPLYGECATLALERSGVYEGMEVLIRIHNHHLEPALLEELVEVYTDRHGPPAGQLLPAIREQRRRWQLLALRSTIADGDVRHVLACLLNSFDRTSFRQQLEQGLASGTTPGVLARCLRQLLGMSQQAEPVLGIAAAALLEDIGTGTFSSWFAGRTAEPVSEAQAAVLDDLYRQLRCHPLLTPLTVR